MERGLRRKVVLYENWCDTPVSHNINYEIEDIISFAILTVDTNDVIYEWKNPKYERADINEAN